MCWLKCPHIEIEFSKSKESSGSSHICSGQYEFSDCGNLDYLYGVSFT